MTMQRDLKKLARQRMVVTGENYTTARAAIIAKATAQAHAIAATLDGTDEQDDHDEDPRVVGYPRVGGQG